MIVLLIMRIGKRYHFYLPVDWSINYTMLLTRHCIILARITSISRHFLL
jgi:hypothetical protein